MYINVAVENRNHGTERVYTYTTVMGCYVMTSRFVTLLLLLFMMLLRRIYCVLFCEVLLLCQCGVLKVQL